MSRAWLWGIAAAFALSCDGTTGGSLVSFSAYASGPRGVTTPYAFHGGDGYDISLTTALFHIGAVYVTDSAANLSSSNTSCVNPGRYILEVPGGVDINLLSDQPQQFPLLGDGTTDRTLTGEIWLVHGAAGTALDTIDEADDFQPVARVEGTAIKDGQSVAFRGDVTIGSNRLKANDDPSQPGLNPICKRRIVSGLPANLVASQGGALLVTVDPAGWFNLLDFSGLIPSASSTGCTPKVCGQIGVQGAVCGSADDGCGNVLQCGTCPLPSVCGGGGVPGQCAAGTCVPTSCAALGFSCGMVSDGCDAALDCGSCAAPLTCGGGGAPGQCGMVTYDIPDNDTSTEGAALFTGIVAGLVPATNQSPYSFSFLSSPP